MFLRGTPTEPPRAGTSPSTLTLPSGRPPRGGAARARPAGRSRGASRSRAAPPRGAAPSAQHEGGGRPAARPPLGVWGGGGRAGWGWAAGGWGRTPTFPPAREFPSPNPPYFANGSKSSSGERRTSAARSTDGQPVTKTV